MEETKRENFAQPIIVEQNVTKDSNNKHMPEPGKRSGHRVFATDDHLYVVGGFNSTSTSLGSSTFKDVWALNLLTRQWKPLKLIGAFSDTMASFSLVYVPELSKFYVYGGTGYPFAGNVSSDLYECTLVGDDTCRIEKLQITGESAPKLYGQSSVYRLNYNRDVSVFLSAGTQGYRYNMDTWEFFIHDGVAECRQLGRMNTDDEGRYRHESFIHENTIYTVGGSNDQVYIPLDAITGFCLKENKYFLKKTLPDSDGGGFPDARKGHALVKHGLKVWVFGGFHYPDGDNTPETILSDIWTLDLEDFQWSKLSIRLPEPVFFHAGAATSTGQILSFGGCVTSQPDPIRTQNVTTFFINPPRLVWLCSRSLYNSNAESMDRADENFSFSSPIDLVRHVLTRNTSLPGKTQAASNSAA